MQLPLQMQGFIDTNGGKAQALLCRDADRPTQAMIQWWGPGIKPEGLLVEMIEIGDDSYKVVPCVFYECDDSGGLYQPTDQERISESNDFSCTVKLKGRYLKGSWSNNNKEGEIIFSIPKKPIRINATKLDSWTDFKKWAGDMHREGMFTDFRGHGSSKFSLSSTLHRSKRSRLERFCYETMPQFRGYAESILDVRFKKGDADDFSALLGLAQHHGLPTPLLDWSASAYVAAFFAFSDALENAETRRGDTHVRIFALSRKIASLARPQITLTPVSASITHLSIATWKNARLLAQQGRFLITNIVDLESEMCDIQNKTGEIMLKAVDIPVTCASEALEDLYFMGLSGATMFPGLDGVCKMMRHSMAFKRGPEPAPALSEAPGESEKSIKSTPV